MLVPEEVETFLAVVRAGSLMRASEVVNATQSTVSYRIGALERRLGRRLILRSRGGRGVSLTSEGRHFLTIAERWEGLSWEAKELAELGDLRLSVGSVHVLAGYLLPPLYERLARATPGLTLRLETGTGLDLEERVARGHLHVAFTVFREEHVDLDVLRLMRSPMRVVVNGSPPEWTGRTSVHLSELAAHHEASMPWGTEFAVWRRKQGMGQVRILSDSALALPPLLQHEGAWSIVPEFMIPHLTELTGCRAFDLLPAPPSQDVFRIMRRGRRAAGAPEVRLLDRFLQQTWPEWFSESAPR